MMNNMKWCNTRVGTRAWGRNPYQQVVWCASRLLPKVGVGGVQALKHEKVMWRCWRGRGRVFVDSWLSGFVDLWRVSAGMDKPINSHRSQFKTSLSWLNSNWGWRLVVGLCSLCTSDFKGTGSSDFGAPSGSSTRRWRTFLHMESSVAWATSLSAVLSFCRCSKTLEIHSRSVNVLLLNPIVCSHHNDQN